MITLVARLTAKDGEFETMRSLALAMADAVSAHEPGNVLYAVAEGSGERELVLIERYKDEAALEAHRSAAHFRKIGKQFAPTLAGPPDIVFRLTDCASEQQQH
jgi:quinol monooxygenase YgiN